MKAHEIFSTVLLSLLIAAAPARAQDDDEDDKPVEKSKPHRQAPAEAPAPNGRNQVLCRAFEDVAKRVSPSVVSVGPGAAYGVVVDGVIVTTADAAKGPASVPVKGAVSGTARVIGVDEARGIAVLE